MDVIKIQDGKVIKVMKSPEEKDVITVQDAEMDARAKQAVRVAVEKAEFCKKPIAKYDKVLKKAYVEYADGIKKYVR